MRIKNVLRQKFCSFRRLNASARFGVSNRVCFNASFFVMLQTVFVFAAHMRYPPERHFLRRFFACNMPENRPANTRKKKVKQFAVCAVQPGTRTPFVVVSKIESRFTASGVWRWPAQELYACVRVVWCVSSAILIYLSVPIDRRGPERPDARPAHDHRGTTRVSNVRNQTHAPLGWINDNRNATLQTTTLADGGCAGRTMKNPTTTR